jgi:hypothetical protein
VTSQKTPFFMSEAAQYHSMKVHGDRRVFIRVLLTSTPVGGVVSLSLRPRNGPRYPWNRALGGSQGPSDRHGKGKLVCLADSSVALPVASRYPSFPFPVIYKRKGTRHVSLCPPATELPSVVQRLISAPAGLMMWAGCRSCVVLRPDDGSA